MAASEGDHIVLRSPEEISLARAQIESAAKKPRLSTGSEVIDLLIDEIRKLGSCLSCPVCKSLMKDPVVTPCMHAFCNSCISAVFDCDQKSVRTCPECRSLLIGKHQLRQNADFDKLVDLYIRFHPRQDEESSPVRLSQVASFSQLASNLQGTPPKPIAFFHAHEGVSQISEAEALPTQFGRVGTARETRTEVPETIAGESPGDSGSSEPLRPSRPGFPRTRSIPKFRLSTPGVASQSNNNATVHAANSSQSGKSGGGALVECTPIKQMSTTTTPPTVRVSDLVTSSAQSTALQETTPMNESVSTKTPPTVRLESLFKDSTGSASTSTSGEKANSKRFAHPTARPPAPQFHHESQVDLNIHIKEGHENENKEGNPGSEEKNSSAANPTTNASPSGELGTASISNITPQPIIKNQQANDELKDTSMVDASHKIEEPEKDVIPKGQKDPFRVGAVVTVKRRMGPGENRPGGVAKITRQNPDGTLDVHYTVEGNREKRVARDDVTPGMDVNADSMFGRPATAKSEVTGETAQSDSKQRKRKTPKSSPVTPTSAAPNTKEDEFKILGTTKAPRVSPTESISSEKVAGRSSSSSHKAPQEDMRNMVAMEPAEAVSPHPSTAGTKEKKGKRTRMKPLADATNLQDPIIPLEGSARTDRTPGVRLARYSTDGDQHTRRETTPVVVAITGTFSEKKRRELKAQVESLGGTLVDPVTISLGNEGNAETLWHGVTHVVTSTIAESPQNLLIASKRSIKYLMGLSLGLWILSAKWVMESSKAKRWLLEDEFQVAGDESTFKLSLGGPMLSREARARFLLSNDDSHLLFSGKLFAFVGAFSDSSIDPLILAKAQRGEIYMDQTFTAEQFSLDSFLASAEYRSSVPRRAFVVLFEPTEQVLGAKRSGANQRRSLRSSTAVAELLDAPTGNVDEESLPIVDFTWFLDCLSTYSVLDTRPYLVPRGRLLSVSADGKSQSKQ